MGLFLGAIIVLIFALNRRCCGDQKLELNEDFFEILDPEDEDEDDGEFRIYSGGKVDKKEHSSSFPHHVQLAARTNRVRSRLASFCGGVLLTRRAALSAAHCAHSKMYRSGTEGPFLVAGYLDCEKKGEAYDVAVFSSSAPFSRSPHAVPACALWFPTERTDGFDENIAKSSSFSVAGMGLRESGVGAAGEGSCLLRKGAARVYTRAETEAAIARANDKLSSEAYSAADFVVVRMLSGNNTCRGDSGGAIVAKWKGRVEVVLGTLSFTCATDNCDAVGCSLRDDVDAYFVSTLRHWQWLWSVLGHLNVACSPARVRRRLRETEGASGASKKEGGGKIWGIMGCAFNAHFFYRALLVE